MKIPKIIHYVWLGNGCKDVKIEKCISSWKKQLPDYKIVEWNETMVEHINNDFMKEALKEKKWAFASDYIRLYALYNYGGLYMDTDLEIKSPIDKFLDNDFFCGFEDEDGHPSTALLGAVPKSKIVKNLLDYYKDKNFIIDGGLNIKTNPKIFKEIFKNYNNDIENCQGSFCDLAGLGKIYPIGYFCKAQSGCYNYAIHHFAGSWIDNKIKRIIKIWRIEWRLSSSKYPYKFDEDIHIIYSFRLRKDYWLSVVFLRKNKNNAVNHS